MGHLASKASEHFRNGGLSEILKLVFLRIKHIVSGEAKKEKKRIREANLKYFEKGSYKKRGFSMFCLRYLGRLFNLHSVIKNKHAKILVVLHFFYSSSIDEVITYLKNLSCYDFDLVVTYPEIDKYEDMRKKIKAFKPDAKIVKCKNNGYDIGPFIKILNRTSIKKYDIVLKLQTKSTHKSAYIYEQFFQNRDWFRNLWDGVLGPFAVHKMVNTLANDTGYGIVAAKNLIIHDPWHKQELVRETLRKFKKIQYRANYKFVAGTCFAIRSKCLQATKKLKLDVNSFEETKFGFFSLAHVIERAICFVGMEDYDYYGIKVDRWRHLKWHKLEDKLYNLSAMRITELDKFRFSPDFVWNTMEGSFVESYKITKMPVKKIKRAHHDGSIRKLEQCEPYLYLKGDKKSYRKYAAYHRKNNLPLMTAPRFKRLLKSIKEKGYDERFIPVVNRRNIIWDGQHRMCILLDLYGGDYKVKVIKLKAIFVNFEKVKKFSDKIETSIRYN